MYRLRLLNSAQFGIEHAEAVKNAHLRAERMLSILYDDFYGLDGSEEQIPQPPNAS